MKGVGIYSAEEAISYSLSGANLRCTEQTGIFARDEPYSIYDRFNFDIPVGSVGDAWDRYVCRMQEIEESLKIVEQAVQQISKGRTPCGESAENY